jgi:hypothetical protein
VIIAAFTWRLPRRIMFSPSSDHRVSPSGLLDEPRHGDMNVGVLPWMAARFVPEHEGYRSSGEGPCAEQYGDAARGAHCGGFTENVQA